MTIEYYVRLYSQQVNPETGMMEFLETPALKKITATKFKEIRDTYY